MPISTDPIVASIESFIVMAEMAKMYRHIGDDKNFFTRFNAFREMGYNNIDREVALSRASVVNIVTSLTSVMAYYLCDSAEFSQTEKILLVNDKCNLEKKFKLQDLSEWPSEIQKALIVMSRCGLSYSGMVKVRESIYVRNGIVHNIPVDLGEYGSDDEGNVYLIEEGREFKDAKRRLKHFGSIIDYNEMKSLAHPVIELINVFPLNDPFLLRSVDRLNKSLE